MYPIFHLLPDAPKPVAPYSHAVEAGAFVFVTGQLATDNSGDLLQLFRIVGLIHIVVLSGYNMTVVADGVARLFRFLSLRSRTVVGTVLIILFSLMVGGGATVIRAAIMTILALIARTLGRVADAGRLLFIAGIIMLLENPRILLGDPSFQLSFLATLGLIYLSPLVEKRLMWIPSETMRIRSVDKQMQK